MAKRIIFFRSGAIGDIVHCLPTLKLVKEKNPEDSVEIIVAGEQVKELLDNHCQYIDRVHLIREIVSRKYIGFDGKKEFVYLHSTWWKAIAWNFKYIKAQKIIFYRKNISLSARENFAVTYFPGLEENFKNNENDLGQEALISSSKSSENYICIVPGVGPTRPHRAYPFASWVELIKLIIEKTDLNIKLLGGPDEIALSERFTEVFQIDLKQEKHMRRIENLIGQTKLCNLPQILINSRHIFSGDTGILHIASALGCSSLKISSIYSVSSEHRTGPFSAYAKIFRSSSCTCNPNGRDRSNSKKLCSNLRNGYASCLWDISPQQLFAESFKAL